MSGGTPEHVPTEETRKLVRDFYSTGVTQLRLAEYIGITEVTLRKHYRAELDLNLDKMSSTLGNNLYQDALSGDKQAREFWLKTRARWSFARDEEKKTHTESLLEKAIEALGKK